MNTFYLKRYGNENVFCFLIMLTISFFSCTNVHSQTDIYIHPENVIINDFEGWGTSMAWWAEDAGDYYENDIAKLEELANMLIHDLNFTTFRYNIGGSCDEDKENNCPTINLGLNPQRTIPNMNEPDRGLNQRRMLTAIAKVGKKSNKPMKFETFSNSPPYWMLKSGSPTGGYNGQNNLVDTKYENFAEYLVRATGYINDDLSPYGFKVESIEPFNEPDAYWWKFNNNPNTPKQEGSSFNNNNQVKMINILYDEIQEKNAPFYIGANDNFKMSPEVLKFYRNQGLFNKIGNRFSFHDYSGSIQDRKEVHALATAAGKNVWISEGGLIGIQNPGNGYEFQLRFMDRISKDLKYLRPKRWLDWQVMDTHPNWTAIDYYAYMEKGQLLPNKRFYMMQHFTKHFAIGDDELFSTSDLGNVVSFRSADGKKLSIVIVNITKDTQEYNIDLSDFYIARYGKIKQWLTDNKTYNHQQIKAAHINTSKSLKISLGPISITTIEIPITGNSYSSCKSSKLTADYDIGNDNIDWKSYPFVMVEAGTPLKLSPKSSTDGDWVWSGTATEGTTREQTITLSCSTTATAKFTNTCGETSSITYLILVKPVACPPTPIQPNVLHNNSWSQNTKISINSGDFVKIGPQPTTGTWRWSGCEIRSDITSRELIFHPKHNCIVTATHTNLCGTKSTLDFEIIIDNEKAEYTNENPNERVSVTQIKDNPSSDVIIYPNPTADGIFNLNIPTYFSTTNFMKVYDITGKMIIDKEVTTGINVINTNYLENGTYLLTISNNYQHISKTLIINK